MGDDGSCFFHSLACACNIDRYDNQDVPGKIKIGHNLRKLIEKSLSHKSWTRFWKQKKLPTNIKIPTYETIRKELSNTKTWAHVYMILYVQDVMNLNIIFFDATAGSIYCGVKGKPFSTTVFILWINRVHFEPIVRIQKFRFLQGIVRIQNVRFLQGAGAPSC